MLTMVNAQFNPAQIPGGVLWLESPDPAANGVRPANATGLATFVDEFRKVNNFTQVTGANQPIFNLNQIKGLPTLNFSSAAPSSMSSISNTVLPIGSTARTFFLVVKFTTVATQQFVFSYGTPGIGGGGFSVGISSAALPIISYGGTILFTGTTTIAAGSAYIFSVNYPSGGQAWDAVFKVNNVAQTASGTNGTVNTNVGSGISIGKSIGIGNVSDCQLAQIVGYNSALNSSLENAVYQYLRQRWQ